MSHTGNSNNKKIIDPDKTKELQKDWQGYGKSMTYFGLVVLVIFIVSVLYHLLF
ncbi:MULTISPECIES: hypothetical protein [Anaerostipes]|uniref:hypothetical protein n=1 Tax=Anaerostipes TaxID=207244 RepID=UPI001C1E5464|nr:MULTISPECIES: hypothetical protein [Anaerostipes]MCI5623525.1 hypothetical protein [Anaerostipes sp.]